MSGFFERFQDALFVTVLVYMAIRAVGYLLAGLRWLAGRAGGRGRG